MHHCCQLFLPRHQSRPVALVPRLALRLHTPACGPEAWLSSVPVDTDARSSRQPNSGHMPDASCQGQSPERRNWRSRGSRPRGTAAEALRSPSADIFGAQARACTPAPGSSSGLEHTSCQQASTRKHALCEQVSGNDQERTRRQQTLATLHA